MQTSSRYDSRAERVGAENVEHRGYCLWGYLNAFLCDRRAVVVQDVYWQQ